MCGLTGFWAQSGVAEGAATLSAMSSMLRHRGPDSHGQWLDEVHGIGLAHRRLAIVDGSEAGHQPMVSPSGRYVLVYNGEIYNHLDLRSSLGGKFVAWRGGSDTETLCVGFDAWGIEETIRRCIGMFAMAVWDRQQRSLSLVRDRLGEKPMHYGWQGHGVRRTFLFGSELAALRCHPSFSADIDRDALSLLLRHNTIPAPYTIHQGIRKLRPGHLLVLSEGNGQASERAYWSLPDKAVQLHSSHGAKDSGQIVDELQALLLDAVRRQMVADVPLGAFLSGGVDSSTIVALMQAQSDRPVNTFSIGFDVKGFDEAPQARAVARHLGTQHHELYVSSRDALNVIPKLPSIYDEPFSDSSQIPTYLVSKWARASVTVSLSGDGGDELFAGYTRHRMTASVWPRLEKLPWRLRRAMAGAIERVSVRGWNWTGQQLARLSPRMSSLHRLGETVHKGAAVLGSRDVDQLYTRLVSHWMDPASVVLRSEEPATLVRGNEPNLDGLDPVERMMVLDMMTYLPDDILTKVDRAAMSVSLETRVPFLDYRVVEFALGMPLQYKLRDGASKWALRQVLYRHVPQALIDRPKMGFGIPLNHWLRGPLREWVEAQLSTQRLATEGYFDVQAVREKWRQHLAGIHDWQFHLWDILMFQAWLEAQGSDA